MDGVGDVATATDVAGDTAVVVTATVAAVTAAMDA
jgi:hypothetical protein